MKANIHCHLPIWKSRLEWTLTYERGVIMSALFMVGNWRCIRPASLIEVINDGYDVGR